MVFAACVPEGEGEGEFAVHGDGVWEFETADAGEGDVD